MDENAGKRDSPRRFDALTFSAARVTVLTGIVCLVLLLTFFLIKAPSQPETEIKIGLSFVPLFVFGVIAWIVDKRHRSRRLP